MIQIGDKQCPRPLFPRPLQKLQLIETTSSSPRAVCKALRSVPVASRKTSTHTEVSTRTISRAPQLFMVEVVTKSNLACELRQIPLSPLPHKLLQGKVHEFALRSYAGERERFLDEFIIDHDVRPHGFPNLCLKGVFESVLYTSMGGIRSKF